jgi:hypothetical protein
MLQISFLFVTVQLFTKQNEPVFTDRTSSFLLLVDLSFKLYRVLAFTGVAVLLVDSAR